MAGKRSRLAVVNPASRRTGQFGLAKSERTPVGAKLREITLGCRRSGPHVIFTIGEAGVHPEGQGSRSAVSGSYRFRERVLALRAMFFRPSR